MQKLAINLLIGYIFTCGYPAYKNQWIQIQGTQYGEQTALVSFVLLVIFVMIFIHKNKS